MGLHSFSIKLCFLLVAHYQAAVACTVEPLNITEDLTRTFPVTRTNVYTTATSRTGGGNQPFGPVYASSHYTTSTVTQLDVYLSPLPTSVVRTAIAVVGYTDIVTLSSSNGPVAVSKYTSTYTGRSTCLCGY